MSYSGTPEEKKAKANAAARRWREKPENLAKSQAASRKSIAERRKRDPEFAERQRQASAAWRLEHLDELRKYRWGRNHRAANLKKFYDLSLEQYQKMCDDQGGVCAICSQPPLATGRNNKVLHVDHDHTTGKIRGLLCNQCNTALAAYEADPTWGSKAADYLSRL